MAQSRGPLIKVEGVRELQRDLRRAAGPGLNKEFGRENKQIGVRIIAAARPVAPNVDGDLREAMRASANARSVIIRAGGRKAPHAPIVHWGSRYRPNTAAQPFIAQTVQARRLIIQGMYLAGVERVVRTVAAN